MNRAPVPAAEVTVLFVLSAWQQREYQDELRELASLPLNIQREPSAQAALKKVGDLKPRIIVVGTSTDDLDGLEFVAKLPNGWPPFTDNVIVLPGRNDPFPPLVQRRDPGNDRSSTVESSLEETLELIRALVPKNGYSETRLKGNARDAIDRPSVARPVLPVQRSVSPVPRPVPPSKTISAAPAPTAAPQREPAPQYTAYRVANAPFSAKTSGEQATGFQHIEPSARASSSTPQSSGQFQGSHSAVAEPASPKAKSSYFDEAPPSLVHASSSGRGHPAEVSRAWPAPPPAVAQNVGPNWTRQERWLAVGTVSMLAIALTLFLLWLMR